ncbi:MAG TPA: NDP-sugar synthase [Candidatus Thermoplasmatota archaeon]|nr:NDP-sugar synthase [Candidatus Thermoplasmatota archaeon]
MEAIVLAGGLGTRLRPLTYSRPKPLLPIVNKPMVDWVLASLPPAVKKVVIPVNYLSELVEAHFDEHPDPRVELVDEPAPMGTGGAIKRVEKHFTGPFFVYNADIISSNDLDGMRKFHAARKAKATISLWRVEDPWHYGVVKFNGQARIEEFVEKPEPGKEPSNLINAGHYLLDLDVLDDIPKNKFVSLEREIFTPMATAKGGRLFGYEFQGHWIDCGRPESYLEAHRLTLRAQGVARAEGEDVSGLKGARFESYAVGDRVELGAGAVVQRSVVLADARIGAHAVLRDCVIGEGADIEAGAQLDRVVVGDYAVVQGNVNIKDRRIGMRPGDE